ncbi:MULTISPECIES: DUF4149 domain-containing protein [Leptospirillum]|jgi:hypothetical protein|uniref:TMEM205-like domain-containing protein n=2 Tax=Leptospirillum ferriphilum TaxID=178606 RepID=A0A059Y1M0_9BACT|nr:MULTISPECIES: DUF4149 domain-containing protein [Leptospirillum]EAY57961.1 MAG: probable membrane protein [Leptospirillum rubarum]EIJ77306.1 MAG: putative membrane protein [Leptospirillum sp. Group II 'C75']AIA31367.1 hypothetical protein Y981_00485 [Leptospirillum ferriphilum YSK]AKS22540.1 hypothetical protein ABH19_00370 [Leptospirillum sp. Group II 'CF-1']OOH71897.1 hypothetical protein BOX24_07445 [Leptospirillum ferriphilum]
MVLQRLLYLIYGYVLVFLAGGTLIFTLFVTPVLFHSLGKEQAGHIVGVLFPPYFHLLFVFTLVSLLLQGSRVALKPSGGRKSLYFLGILTTMTGYLALSLGPRAMSSRAAWYAKPGDASLKATFDSLHQQSVLLNGFILAGYLGLVLFLLTEPPSTHGGKSRVP